MVEAKISLGENYWSTASSPKVTTDGLTALGDASSRALPKQKAKLLRLPALE